MEPDADLVLLYAHDADDAQGDERSGWDVTLALRNLRFPLVEVTSTASITTTRRGRRWRRSPPGDNGVYPPEEVAAFEDGRAARAVPGAVRLRDRRTAGSIWRRGCSRRGVVFLECAGPTRIGDGVYDPEDCAPDDAQVYRAPVEIEDLAWSDRDTLAWTSTIPAAGPATVHDVSRDATCLACRSRPPTGRTPTPRPRERPSATWSAGGTPAGRAGAARRTGRSGKGPARRFHAVAAGGSTRGDGLAHHHLQPVHRAVVDQRDRPGVDRRAVQHRLRDAAAPVPGILHA